MDANPDRMKGYSEETRSGTRRRPQGPGQGTDIRSYHASVGVARDTTEALNRGPETSVNAAQTLMTARNMPGFETASRLRLKHKVFGALA
jgi:hypothetical protein